MIGKIQNSIRAFYALSQTEEFANAKTYKDARQAVELWKIQYQIDDAKGESYLPADNFSNFALLLATMYKGEKQTYIQSTFNRLYDLIQGAQEENLFDQPDNTPRTLTQAIKEVLNIEYDGQYRSIVLGNNTTTSQRRHQGSTGDATTGEGFRMENGQPTIQEALRQKAQQAAKPYINPNPNEKDLNKLLMSDGKETAQEWLMTQPKKYWERATEAIYECLKRGWTLHTAHIQMIARELDAQRNPKGW